ncbi:cyclase family protein [Candidatus Sumerlaeota bacterium]|nr:cyclase family protein [Candidatus Sumerlaeota bacterium]
MKKIIDLSHVIEEGMLTFIAPWHPMVEISIMGRHGLEGRETRKIVFGTHTGTHIDAPAHFVPGGSTIDETSLDALVGKAFLVRFPQCLPKRKINIRDVKKQLPDLSKVKRVIFRFDWSRFWGQEQFYKDWPFFSLELASWLIEGGVTLVGMDTPSPDNPMDDRASGNDSPLHKLFLKNGVTLVEYLARLDEVKTDSFDLVALPLKIKQGDGSPSRVIALVNE